MPRRRLLGLPVVLVLLVSAPSLRAQEAGSCVPARFFPLESAPRQTSNALSVSPTGRLCAASAAAVHLESDAATVQGVTPSNVSPGRAFLYSALVPGGGQYLLGQERWVPYVAVEVWGWVQLFLRRSRGRDLSRRYRDLAWDVARRVSEGTREDGDFNYYESLTHFRSSGAFDRDPLTPGVQPETDPETYNGSIWELAGEIFFPPGAEDPPAPGSTAYDRALEYYLGRSVTPRFAWRWGEGAPEQSVYSDLIRASDEQFRSSTTMIGLILANHFVSAIDALVSARLRDMGRDPESFSLEAQSPGPFGLWGVSIRIRP